MSNLPLTTNGHVLIVDDQPQNVLLLEKILASAGYKNVMGCTDPRLVLPLFSENRFDLILLDINMPHLDGFQVMAQLNEIIEETYLPVLVLTAQTDHATRIKALQNGAKDFLTKPFDRIEVLSRIKNLLEVQMMQTQLINHNQLLESKVKERTQELNETRLEIIRRLGMAAEFRDHETGNHIIRMSHFSRLTALAMGLSDDEADLILNAAPMHDIGKIGIPDRILLKPGQLDEAEWVIMRDHVTIGAELLDGHGSELLNTARMIALTHHECWDGSGYPLGDKGEDIPLYGRIVAIGDVFDALTSVRPYKKAWSIDAAVAEIRRQRGRCFDPKVVDAFMEVLPEVLEIKSQFVDTLDGTLQRPHHWLGHK